MDILQVRAQRLQQPWVNSGSRQVTKLKHLMAILAREADDKSTSRAESQGTKVPIKLEDKGMSSLELKDRDK